MTIAGMALNQFEYSGCADRVYVMGYRISSEWIGTFYAQSPATFTPRNSCPAYWNGHKWMFKLPNGAWTISSTLDVPGPVYAASNSAESSNNIANKDTMCAEATSGWLVSSNGGWTSFYSISTSGGSYAPLHRPVTVTGGIVARLPRPNDQLQLDDCVMVNNHPYSIGVRSGTGNVTITRTYIRRTAHGISAAAHVIGQSDTGFNGSLSVTDAHIGSNLTGISHNGTIGGGGVIVRGTNFWQCQRAFTGIAIYSQALATIDAVQIVGYRDGIRLWTAAGSTINNATISAVSGYGIFVNAAFTRISNSSLGFAEWAPHWRGFISSQDHQTLVRPCNLYDSVLLLLLLLLLLWLLLINVPRVNLFHPEHGCGVSTEMDFNSRLITVVLRSFL